MQLGSAIIVGRVKNERFSVLKINSNGLGGLWLAVRA